MRKTSARRQSVWSMNMSKGGIAAERRNVGRLEKGTGAEGRGRKNGERERRYGGAARPRASGVAWAVPAEETGAHTSRDGNNGQTNLRNVNSQSGKRR